MKSVFFLIIIAILIVFYTRLHEPSPTFAYALAPELAPDCTGKITAPAQPSVVFTKETETGLYTATVGGNSKLQFMCNMDVSSPSIKPTKVFQMIHGMTRDVKGYFNMANSAWGRTALVWAPRFSIKSEIPNASYNYWTQSSAATGDPSGGPSNMTSFEFLDAINGAFFKLYPITVAALAGHSFGGQCVARYTGLSYLPELFPKINIYFCILSPSSFLWIVPDRPSASTGNCSGNNWFYGLDRLNPYATKMGASNIYCNYMNRNVLVMIGTKDTQSAMLDQSCQANTQGANRYQRAQNFNTLMLKLGAKHYQYETFVGGHGTNLKGTAFTKILG